MPLTCMEGYHKEETTLWIHASNWNEDVIEIQCGGRADPGAPSAARAGAGMPSHCRTTQEHLGGSVCSSLCRGELCCSSWYRDFTVCLCPWHLIFGLNGCHGWQKEPPVGKEWLNSKPYHMVTPNFPSPTHSMVIAKKYFYPMKIEWLWDCLLGSWRSILSPWRRFHPKSLNVSVAPSTIHPFSHLLAVFET